MSFTDAQIAEVRTWVPWTPPSDAEIDDAADTLDAGCGLVTHDHSTK